MQQKEIYMYIEIANQCEIRKIKIEIHNCFPFLINNLSF